MKKKIFVAEIFFFLLLPLFATAQMPDTAVGSRTLNIRSPLVIYGSAGYLFGLNADQNVALVSNAFGNSASFNAPVNISAGVKTEISNGMKAGLNTGYAKGKMGNLDLHLLPILATIDYTPIRTQFTTYVGAGLGASFNKINWYEQGVANIPFDSGGFSMPLTQSYKESFISPAARLYAGVELDFDKRGTKSVLGGLLVELRYNYIPISEPVLRGLTTQIPAAAQQFINTDAEYEAGGSNIELCLGISLQFERW